MLTYTAFEVWKQILSEEPSVPKYEAGTELEKRRPFQSLVDDLYAVGAATMAVLESADATEEHKASAFAEFSEMARETDAELKRRLEEWWPGLDREGRPH